MPIEKAVLNYGQLTLGEHFEELVDDKAPSPAEAAARSEAARGALFLLIKNKTKWQEDHAGLTQPENGELPGWLDIYLDLLNKGWPWRQAVYIAWDASPRQGRWPESQEDLATHFLGLSSDRVISTWRAKNPAIDAMVGTLQAAALFHHRADVLEALIASAREASYQNHPDRKLFLEMTGDYVPISQLKALIASGQFKTQRNLEDLNDDELKALAGGDLSLLLKSKEQAETSE